MSAQSLADSPVLTFLFTDIEGSSSLWERTTTIMEQSVARQESILRQAIADRNGRVVKTMGDGLYAVFPDAADAVLAAVTGMQRVSSEPWPEETPIRVRMGLNSGQAFERGGDFYGPPVNRAARLEAAANGGQIVASSPTVELATGALPSEVELVEIGEVRLRGMSEPEKVSQVRAVGLDADFPPLVGVTAPNNLPIPVDPFVGRAEKLGEVEEALQRSRQVTLVGFGGIGKTRLALETARDQMLQYPDGVWFVDLSTISSSDLVAQSLASTLGLEETPGQDLVNNAANALARQRSLIILDNCEHVLDETASVSRRLVAGTEHLRLMCTSRERLNIPGETIVDVTPLGVGDETGERGPAEQLFIERARAVRPGFSPSADDLAAISEICVHLDGIPLAIELAASRVRMLAPRQIAERLDQRFELLTGGPRATEQHHETLKELVDWSYQLLEEPERLLFDRLSVFAGGFDLQAAEGVCSGEGIAQTRVFDLVADLVDQSLVRLDDSESELRFVLLETLRAYGRARLEEARALDVMRARHAGYYASVVAGTDERLKGPDQREWHLWLQRNEPDLLHAMSFLTGEQPELGLEMAGELGRYWYRSGALSVGREVTSAALSAAGAAPTPARAHALVWMPTFESDDEETAVGSIETAIAIFRELEDHRGLADALNALGNVAHLQGRLSMAAEYWQESIDVGERTGTTWFVAPLYNLGSISTELGDTAKARSSAARLFQLGRSNADPWATAKGHLLSAHLALFLGESEEVEKEAALAEEMFLDQGVVYHAADAMYFRSLNADLSADPDTAMRHLEKMRETLGDSTAPYEAELGTAQARIALRQEDFDGASTSLCAMIENGLGGLYVGGRIDLLHESARLAALLDKNLLAIQLLEIAEAWRAESGIVAMYHQAEEATEMRRMASELELVDGSARTRNDGEARSVSQVEDLIRSLLT